MKYELMVIIDPTLTDQKIEAKLTELKELFAENGLSLLDEDVWGHRALAYKIKQHRNGYYVVLLFDGEPAGLPEIQREMRLQSSLIRYMIVKMPEDYASILRYDHSVVPAAADAKPKLSKHAAELSKKVSKKSTAPASEDKKEEEEKDEEKEKQLDEKLKAIMDDTDIDV